MLSIKTRQKISLAMQKYYELPESRAKTSAAMRTKLRSEQQQAQLKQLHDAKRGIPRSPEQRKAISIALKSKRWGKGYRISDDRYIVRIFTGWTKHARAVWVISHGPISGEHVIHHRDGDSFNDEIDNLELLSHSDHSRLHKSKAT